MDELKRSGESRWRRLGAVGILQPLAVRDFAFLWAGMTVSFLGDGIYFVAIAWQVYILSDSPTALSIVGVAWTVPQVSLLLVGGLLSDRFDRRKVMVAADVVRGLSVLSMGLLSVTGSIELWHLFVLAGVYGAGEALFGPAFGAIVPDLIPQDLLVQANSLDQFVRPFMLRMAGPALGGWSIAAFGPGSAFLLDGATFAVSVAALLAMNPQPRIRSSDASLRSALGEIREGFLFVRSETWLWGTLVAAAVGLLAFYGPAEVLIPFVVKNELGGSAADLGLVFAVSGVGAILAALAMGQRGLPRRHMVFMYLTFSAGTLLVAGWGLATELWQVMAISFLIQALVTLGQIVWTTLMHRLVPAALLGRVSSLDWLVSISLVPASFALTGPIASGIGPDATLIGAGAIGGGVFFLFLLLPGMRDTERDGRLLPAAPATEQRL